jgi:hypothetical protein
MQQAARAAFKAQSLDTPGAQAGQIKGAAGEIHRGIWIRVIGNSVITFLAGLLASAMSHRLTAHGVSAQT